jgi:hypothetical protein
MSHEAEVSLMLGLFALGGVVGLLFWKGPLSGWAALAFPLILGPLGMLLTYLFC